MQWQQANVSNKLAIQFNLIQACMSNEFSVANTWKIEVDADDTTQEWAKQSWCTTVMEKAETIFGTYAGMYSGTIAGFSEARNVDYGFLIDAQLRDYDLQNLTMGEY